MKNFQLGGKAGGVVDSLNRFPCGWIDEDGLSNLDFGPRCRCGPPDHSGNQHENYCNPLLHEADLRLWHRLQPMNRVLKGLPERARFPPKLSAGSRGVIPGVTADDL
jgi:hypothetical protein